MNQPTETSSNGVPTPGSDRQRRAWQINWCFWYPAFLFLAWVNYLFLEKLERVPEDQQLLVFLVAAGHLMILVLALAWVDALVERSPWRAGKLIFAGVCFVLMAGFYFDFLLFQLMGIHLTKGFRILTEGGWRQFLLTVEATGLRKPALAKGMGGLCLLSTGGALVVRGARWLSSRRPVRLGSREIGACCLCLAGVAAGLEYAGLHSDKYRRAVQEAERVMPFYVGLWSSSPGAKYSGAHLRPLRTRAESETGLVNAVIATGKRPDIFVFILESTRGDYLDAQTTPNLAQLRSECLPFADSLANADATHVSCFALLTANYPLYFAMAEKAPDHPGSVPLRLLHRAGYQIHVLAGNYMNYHNLDKLVFGEHLALVSSLTDARSMEELDRPDRDRHITKLLLQKLEEPRGGRVFLVFYESTHHDYYWPADASAPFQPYADSWDYGNFKIGPKELEGIKNRYRNALHFVDGLFGEISNRLKATGQHGDAIILVTGDHGEEFLEHGKMVHASETCRAQTHVPIYLKLPQGAAWPGGGPHPLPTASHVDVMPTLLDYLGVQETNLYDGESLFRKPHDQVVMVEENGSRDPYLFCIQAGKSKAWFQYRDNGRPIAFERNVYLQKVTDANDQLLPVDAATAEGRRFVRETFGDGLRQLYPDIKL